VIVLDASAVLELLLRTPSAEIVERRIFARQSLHAPHLIDVEVAQVLRRYAASGEVDAGRCREALEDMGDLPLARYSHDMLLPRIWELRGNLTAYDAAYVALAEALEAPLLTCDRKLSRAPGLRARVELV
jgi:predicted nucleic acid-binding protein